MLRTCPTTFDRSDGPRFGVKLPDFRQQRCHVSRKNLPTASSVTGNVTLAILANASGAAFNAMETSGV